MGAVSTLAVTVAAAVGGIALYRFVERQQRRWGDYINDAKTGARSDRESPTIDYERDPQSGVYKPKQ